MERPDRNKVKVILASNLGPRYRKATFENFECRTPELEQAKDRMLAAALNLESLFIYGDDWIGKTHLAAAYLNYHLNQGTSGVYVSGSYHLWEDKFIEFYNNSG